MHLFAYRKICTERSWLCAFDIQHLFEIYFEKDLLPAFVMVSFSNVTFHFLPYVCFILFCILLCCSKLFTFFFHWVISTFDLTCFVWVFCFLWERCFSCTFWCLIPNAVQSLIYLWSRRTKQITTTSIATIAILQKSQQPLWDILRVQ